MLYAGIDLGSTTGKIAVVDDAFEPPQLAAWSVRPSGFAPLQLAGQLLDDACAACGISSSAGFAGVCVTGYGRESIASVGRSVSEISCHAAGAHWANPQARTVIDVGGQDVKVIALGEDGSMANFCMNDKCAAGTGRFFEAMARILRCDIRELGDMALAAQESATITSTCSVFAESEVVALINRQIPRENIARGIEDSIAERIFGMTQRVGLAGDVMLTGGCGKSEGLRRAIERRCGMPIATLREDPQIIGAVGAALIARKGAGHGR